MLDSSVDRYVVTLVNNIKLFVRVECTNDRNP